MNKFIISVFIASISFLSLADDFSHVNYENVRFFKRRLTFPKGSFY